MKLMFTKEKNTSSTSENVKVMDEFFTKQKCNYRRTDNSFRIAFAPPSENDKGYIVLELHVFNDHIFVSTLLGFDIPDEFRVEALKVINYINAEEIKVGRFELSRNNAIWFDFALNLRNQVATPEECRQAVNLPLMMISPFFSFFYGISKGYLWAEDITEPDGCAYKKYDDTPTDFTNLPIVGCTTIENV